MTLPKLMWAIDANGNAAPCEVVGTRYIEFGIWVVTPKIESNRVLVRVRSVDTNQTSAVWWPLAQLKAEIGGVKPEGI